MSHDLELKQLNTYQYGRNKREIPRIIRGDGKVGNAREDEGQGSPSLCARLFRSVATMGWLDIINSSELVSDAELERMRQEYEDFLHGRK